MTSSPKSRRTGCNPAEATLEETTSAANASGKRKRRKAARVSEGH
jgi:hypothetical protein